MISGMPTKSLLVFTAVLETVAGVALIVAPRFSFRCCSARRSIPLAD